MLCFRVNELESLHQEKEQALQTSHLQSEEKAHLEHQLQTICKEKDELKLR